MGSPEQLAPCGGFVSAVSAMGGDEDAEFLHQDLNHDAEARRAAPEPANGRKPDLRSTWRIITPPQDKRMQGYAQSSPTDWRLKQVPSLPVIPYR